MSALLHGHTIFYDDILDSDTFGRNSSNVVAE